MRRIFPEASSSRWPVRLTAAEAERARGRVVSSPPGLGIITGKADLNDSDPNAVNPGGVPLYKNGRMVGGIGVTGVAPNVAEYAAFAGSLNAGFLSLPLPDPGAVFINGIELPFVNQTTQPSGTTPVASGTSPGVPWGIG